MDILKSFMVCIWGSLPFSIAILKVELNVGEFLFIFLKSHAPESIHSGFPFLPFCILAIVPVTVLSDTGHFALAIDAMLADAIIATVAATTIMMVGLAIQACLFFRNNKNVRVKYIINIIRDKAPERLITKRRYYYSTPGLYNRQLMQYIPMLVLWIL